MTSGNGPDEADRAGDQRSRAIVESALEHAIVTLDADGTVTGWNAGAERILGHKRADILGRSADILLEPGDRQDGWPSMVRRTGETGRAAVERWYSRQDGSLVWLTGVMTPLLGTEGQADGVLTILRDETETHAASEHHRLLMAEMNHRIKNTFTVVQAMAHSTRRHAASVQDFQLAFDSRLMVMARSHDMLMQTDWRDAGLRGVIADVLEPFDTKPARITLSGADILLPSNLVIAVSLALHELATNAVKHGSLSSGHGRVEVSWSAGAVGGDGSEVEVVWVERGGPPVEQPTRGGFGSKLLRMGLLNGSVKLDFLPTGVECRMTLLLRDDRLGSGHRYP